MLVGKRCTNVVAIDPGLVPLTLAVISRNKQKRRVTIVQLQATKLDDGWKDRYLRIKSIASNVKKILSYMPKDTIRIVLEGYAFTSRGSAVQTMAEIRQGLLKELEPYFERMIVVPPPTWKASLFPGLGGKGKDVIIEATQQAWPETKIFGKDDNKYDAYCMAALLEGLLFGELDSPSALKLLDRENIH